jgi:serine phosphatase RsbU (regulator of sigma subunit)/PAS domain-containing protein
VATKRPLADVAGALVDLARRDPMLVLPTQPAEGLRQSLDVMAGLLREAFAVDLAVIRATGEGDAEDDVRGISFADAGHQAIYAPALAELRPGWVGIGEAARESGKAVVWPRLLEEPMVVDRLGEFEERSGMAPNTLADLLVEGSGVAMPLSTSRNPRLGSVTLISLSAERGLGEGERDMLELLAPQISLAVQNAQLREGHRRTRLTLEAVLEATENGILVCDTRGRLSVANRAAGELVGIDVGAAIGQPMRELVADRLKWRFKNPDAFEERLRWLYDHPAEVGRDEVETVEGRTLERFAAPVVDTSGANIGRVEVLTDVTEARQALAEAHRLAEEKAALLEREERRAQEEVALTRAAHVMASALTRADIHDHMLEQAAQLVGAPKTAVLVVDPRGDLVPAATRGFSIDAEKRMIFRRGEGVLGRVVSSQRAFICNDVDADPRVSQRLVGPEGIRSFMHVPIVLGERLYGLLSVNSGEVRAFGERELRVITELARHAAAALQNALQFEQERHIAETLQQSLLAEELPTVPGLQVATLYRAAAGSLVGGDLYNVWRLPGGEVAVLVGDVSGKGVEAAGVTAMVRYMSEALALRHTDPADLVSELNGLLCARLGDGVLVTLFLAVITPEANDLAWCNAGHPPPLLISPSREVRPLGDPGPPAGAFLDARYRPASTLFEPGDLLFICTDGLLEARRHGRIFGDERVREAVLEMIDEPPGALARSAYAAARVWSEGRINDDVAIAVVRRTAS